jgi:hypothetical protein
MLNGRASFCLILLCTRIYAVKVFLGNKALFATSKVSTFWITWRIGNEIERKYIYDNAELFGLQGLKYLADILTSS